MARRRGIAPLKFDIVEETVPLPVKPRRPNVAQVLKQMKKGGTADINRTYQGIHRAAWSDEVRLTGARFIVRRLKPGWCRVWRVE